MKIENDQYEIEDKKDIVLSIIIPVFNNVNYTKSALRDLLKLPSDHEIIIVDNASTDDTGYVVNDLIVNRLADAPSLIYIGCPKNLGFGAALNKATKHARGKNILYLNNDIRVLENYKTWTQKIIDACKDNCLISPTAGVLDKDFNFITEVNALVDCKLMYAFHTRTCEEKSKAEIDYLDSLIINKNKYLSGWCLAGSKGTFDKLILNHYRDDVTDEIKEGKARGAWNEQFFAYFEDVDLSWRAEELGIELRTIPISVHHFGHMTAKKMNLSKLYEMSQKIFKEIWTGKK